MNHENEASEEAEDESREAKLMRLIRKAETKCVGKRKIVQFLKRKGVADDDIICAYAEYYTQDRLYEITFNQRPLAFSVIKDIHGKNAVISSIQNHENIEKGMKIGSKIHEINGQMVTRIAEHKKILKLVGQEACPFYIVFREPKSIYLADVMCYNVSRRKKNGE
eukprot:92806_1